MCLFLFSLYVLFIGIYGFSATLELNIKILIFAFYNFFAYSWIEFLRQTIVSQISVVSSTLMWAFNKSLIP